MESSFVTNVRRSAEDSFSSGLYCAESVLLALADELGIESDVLPRIATGFCSGMGRMRGPCGALTGGLMGIGLALGRSDAGSSVGPSYIAAQRLLGEFEQAFGARDCHVLLGCDLGTEEGLAAFRARKLGERCARFTAKAAEIAARVVEEATTAATPPSSAG